MHIVARKTLRLVLVSRADEEETGRIDLNIRYNRHCLITEHSLARETMTRENPSCCPPLSLSRDSARFYLLFLLMAIYMLAGAALFSSLERPAELLAHRLWERRLKDFSQGHNITIEDLKYLLRHYEEARTAGIRTEKGRALWDIPGAFYFVGTVVSTIGFGVSAPSTLPGKILLVLYGLVGCSATILFFNLFLGRVRALLTLLLSWCHGRRARKSGLDVSTGGGTATEAWNPSVYLVALILFATALLVACGAASLYSAMEGWTFIESLYFCFVAFSTVGFGDFVSGQRAQHQNIPAYQVANCLVMLFGVCCTHSLFSALSLIIKQGLNWMLSALAQVRESVGCHKSHLRTLSKCCTSAPRLTHPCCSEENTLQSQQVRAVMGSDHTMV